MSEVADLLKKLERLERSHALPRVPTSAVCGLFIGFWADAAAGGLTALPGFVVGFAGAYIVSLGLAVYSSRPREAQSLPAVRVPPTLPPRLVMGSAAAVRANAEAVKVSRTIDLILIVAAFLFLLGAFHIHSMLTMTDWDFWTEWKDHRLWVTVTPILFIFFAVLFQMFLWERFQVPFGATLVVLGLLFGEWINRYFFSGWNAFPINYVWPAAMTPMAIWLDVVLLLTNSYILTAVIGASGFALLFFPTNFPMYAPLQLPVDYNGVVMSIADIQGYQYITTMPPGYTEIVDTYGLQHGGGVFLSAFLSAVICMFLYFVWSWVVRHFLSFLPERRARVSVRRRTAS